MTQTIEIHLGSQGRIVLPASVRRELGVEQGAVLLAHVDEGRLVIEPPAHILSGAKARFSRLRGKKSLADELIAERRVDAERDRRL